MSKKRAALWVLLGMVVGVGACSIGAYCGQLQSKAPDRAELGGAHRIAAVVDIKALQALANGDSSGASELLSAQLRFEIAGLDSGYRTKKATEARERCQLALILRYLDGHIQAEDRTSVGIAVGNMLKILPPSEDAGAGGCASAQM